MSKTSRQTTKQNRSATKQSTDQIAKEDQPLKATNQVRKQVQPEKKLITEQPAQSTGRPPTRQAAKYERRREEQRRREVEKQRAIQRKRFTILGGIVAAVLILGLVGYFVYANVITHPVSGPKANTAAAATATATAELVTVNPAYPPVDNKVACDTLEQTAFHVHALLVIYINGHQVPVASQVGIAPDGSCFYWLHTHDSSGIVHIEAPASHIFTLGNFLDEWGQRFSSLQYPAQLDQPGGPGWQIWVNGAPVTGDFHNIELKAHEIITIAYNSPNVQPTTTYAWNGL
jgi:hypothetical protein